MINRWHYRLTTTLQFKIKRQSKVAESRETPLQVCGISLAVDREFPATNDVFVTFDPEKLRGACAEPNRVKANFTLRLHSVPAPYNLPAP